MLWSFYTRICSLPAWTDLSTLQLSRRNHCQFSYCCHYVSPLPASLLQNELAPNFEIERKVMPTRSGREASREWDPESNPFCESSSSNAASRIGKSGRRRSYRLNRQPHEGFISPRSTSWCASFIRLLLSRLFFRSPYSWQSLPQRNGEYESVPLLVTTVPRHIKTAAGWFMVRAPYPKGTSQQWSCFSTVCASRSSLGAETSFFVEGLLENLGILLVVALAAW